MYHNAKTWFEEKTNSNSYIHLNKERQAAIIQSFVHGLCLDLTVFKIIPILFYTWLIALFYKSLYIIIEFLRRLEAESWIIPSCIMLSVCIGFLFIKISINLKYIFSIILDFFDIRNEKSNTIKASIKWSEEIDETLSNHCIVADDFSTQIIAPTNINSDKDIFFCLTARNLYVCLPFDENRYWLEKL